jgi:polyferredoxin
MASPRTSWVVWLRRCSQAGFLLLFLYLFLEAVYHPINEVPRGITLFFDIDPLITLSVWAAGHALLSTALLALATAVVTLVFGRWFCGWVCPLGTVHTLCSSARQARLKDRLEAGAYSTWQRAKYYVLFVSLGASFVGLNLVGWLDPSSFLFRSLTVSIFPAFHAVTQGVFTWLYEANPGLGSLRVTAVSEPVYGWLRHSVLAVEQPHMSSGLLVGSIFVGAAALNLQRVRFWCRYVCPLGALLGILGKNPVVRLTKDPERCNNCRLCVADCHGGANPDGTDSWKPAECMFCWNCHSDCPTQGIGFRFGSGGESAR